MRSILIVGIIALFLVGCSSASKVKTIDVVTKPTEKLKLNLEVPKPLVFEDVEWVIVTEDNIDSIWEAIKKDNKGVALFALKDDDYGRLAMNLAAIREALGEYVIILKKYKEYYEGE